MTQVETQQKKPKASKDIRKQINPEFKEFIDSKISEIKSKLQEFLKKISGKKYETVYQKKFGEILNEIGEITQKFELYTTKFKFYTQETERSLRKFGFLMGELVKELQFNEEAFENEANEIYLLNIVNKWSVFNASVKEMFYNVENNEYPYTIHTIFSLAFVLVPFLNIFSLVGGLYLIGTKDWRGLIYGSITLLLYFMQIINIIFLFFIG